ncbi:MAG TPA: hypothetical protein VEF04_23370, partial [Blastocatellia bacterium]|nr:hypothetical protein [Blastocatellia bacterium]
MRLIKNGVTRRPLTTTAFLASLALAKNLLSDASDEDEDVRKARERRPFTPKIPTPFGDISMMWQVPGVGEVNVARFLSPYYVYDLGSNNNMVNSITDWLPYQLDLSGSPQSKDVRIPFPEMNDVLLGPWAQVAFDRDFRGQSIRDPEGSKFITMATDQEQITNALTYIARSQVPMYRSISDLAAAINGDLDYYGRERSVTQAILNNIIKVQEFESDHAKEQLRKEIGFKLTRIQALEREMGLIKNNFQKEKESIAVRDISIEKKKDLVKAAYDKAMDRLADKAEDIRKTVGELQEPK